MTWTKPSWAFSVEEAPCPCSRFVPTAFSQGFSFSLLVITWRPCWSHSPLLLFWSGLKLLSAQIFLPKEEESVCFHCLQIRTLIKENTPVKYCSISIHIYIKYLIWYTGFFINLLEFSRFFLCFFTIDHSPFATAWFASAFYLPHSLLNTSRRIAFIGHFCLSTGHKHTFDTSIISPKVHYLHCNPQSIFFGGVTFLFS